MKCPSHMLFSYCEHFKWASTCNENMKWNLFMYYCGTIVSCCSRAQVLLQPGPSDGTKGQLDPAKKTAFITVLVIQVDLLLPRHMVKDIVQYMPEMIHISY